MTIVYFSLNLIPDLGAKRGNNIRVSIAPAPVVNLIRQKIAVATESPIPTINLLFPFNLRYKKQYNKKSESRFHSKLSPPLEIENINNRMVASRIFLLVLTQ